jgi:hypothetical protein
MTIIRAAAPLAAALLLTAGIPATAQTTSKTQVSHDTSMDNGVATSKTKVEHVTKRKTHRAKKILGVKVGHKTVTHKTVRESSVSSNGDHSSTVKTQ